MNDLIQTNNEMTTINNGVAPNATTQVAAVRALAEVKGQVMLAKEFPRNITQVMNRIQNECGREGVAKIATYAYARGGTSVTGASIRLAEVLAQNYGNILTGIRELEQRNGESTVQAYAWDLETNYRAEKVFQVPHIRYSKTKGNTLLTDPRDIYELVANNGARRLRACILAVIPKDVVDSAVEWCQKTLAAKCDITPERIKKMVEAFSKFGVTQEMLQDFIQRNLSAIEPAQFLRLMEVHNSLKDGMSHPEDWFDMSKKPQDKNGDAEPAKKGKKTIEDALKEKQELPVLNA